MVPSGFVEGAGWPIGREEERGRADYCLRERSDSIDSIPSTDESVIYEYNPRQASQPKCAQLEARPKTGLSWAPAVAIPGVHAIETPYEVHMAPHLAIAGCWMAASPPQPPQDPPQLHSHVRIRSDISEGSSGVRGTGGEAGPSVDELRRLQRRLSEVAVKPQEKRGSNLHNVASGSSLSTMASDAEELATRCSPSLRHAMSSGSVSSMVSEMAWEDAGDEEGLECAPIVEEDAMACNAETLSAADTQEHEDDAGGSERLFGHGGRSKDFSHNRVPKNVNLLEEYGKGGPEGPPTTMMIRNIPNRYTQRELIRELEDLGFAGTFDFLYVPIDKATMCNVGYAFVNFVEPSWATKCMQTFDNYPFKKYRKARGKIATVSVAHIQGLEANLRHYENAAVNGITRSRKCGPVVMASIAKSINQR